MLVSNEISKNQYVGDGSATEFAYTFPILDSTHIEVYRQLSTETALEAKLVPAEEYTVEGAGVESGGKVVFKVAPSSGTKLSILRNVPITQLYQYQELDSFPAESHENALAKLTMICQGMDERLDRAIVVSPTDTITPDELRNGIFDASQKAQDSASAAKDSETAAAESESNAASSAGAAASSESNASSSATAAAESERNAASSAAAAAESERNAAESESNAADSAAAILELKIEVTTLDPGLPATGDYDPVTGVLHLGIPKGDSGAAAIATPTSLGSVKPQTGDEDGLELEEDGTLRVRKATATKRGSILASVTATASAVPQAKEDGTLDESWVPKPDYWDMYPPYSPLPIWKATLGGSDGRRAIMPGETEAREEWILCDGGSDGKDGTVPDMRGRYIRGASEAEPEGTEGGSEDVVVKLSGSTGATTLNTSQMPSHIHTGQVLQEYRTGNNAFDSFDYSTGRDASSIGSVGGNSSHTHPLSGSVSGTHTDPHLAMHFFIKVV